MSWNGVFGILQHAADFFSAREVMAKVEHQSVQTQL